MRVFPSPNMNGFQCPICKTSADRPVILVPIPGTQRGNIAEAEQVHRACYWFFDQMFKIEKGQDKPPEKFTGETRYYSFGSGQPFDGMHVKITIQDGASQSHVELMYRFFGNCWAGEYTEEDFQKYLSETPCLLEVCLPTRAIRPFFRVLDGPWR